jgi:outer membrane protein with glycine zipper
LPRIGGKPVSGSRFLSFRVEDASMPVTTARCAGALGTLLVICAGCYSPYRSDRGALVGGVGGAGVGALVGNAVGHPGVGALVGAGVGAASGAAIGASLDQIEANNRAQIAAQLGRPVSAGAVTVGDVVGMSRAGVAENLIVTHIQRNGMATPLQANDLIMLQQQGVSPRVVEAMQRPPVAAGQPVVVQGPQPVMYVAPQPYWGPPPPPYPYYRTWRPAPGAPPAN